MTASKAGATLASDGIDLIDEHDARRVLLRLVEQVADAACADTDEHLDELRAGDREERNSRLAGHGLAKQRLASAGRANQEHTLGDARSKRDELFRIFEELHDLGELLLRFLHTRDVSERDGRFVTRAHACARAPKRDHPVVSTLRLSQDPPHESGYQDDQDYVREQHTQQVAAAAVLVVLDDDVVLRAELGHELTVACAVGQHNVVLVPVRVDDDSIGAIDLDRLDLAVGRLGHEVREIPVAGALPALDRLPREPEHQAEHDDQCEIKQAGAGEAAQLNSPRGLIGVSSLTTLDWLRPGIGEIETCSAGSPFTLQRFESTAMPGTQASRSPANTRGQESRSSRGTRASTRMSCSLREPRPPAGRIRNPGLRNPSRTCRSGLR